jgi:tetratricopeptide (TPR) repeat protein
LLGQQDYLPLQTDVIISDHTKNESLKRYEGKSLIRLSAEILSDLEYLWDVIREYPNIRDDKGEPFVYRKYPAVAIQEALVNFVIHRDYFGQEAHIDLYENKIILTNPGYCPYDIARFLESEDKAYKPPHIRNELVIRIFARTKLNQRQRRGLWRIRQSLLENKNIDSDGDPLLTINNDRLLNQFQLIIGAAKPPLSTEEWKLIHKYPLQANFTGRLRERQLLSDWLDRDKDNPLFLLRALGGFGKSALVWHWLINDVDPTQWTKVLWWSFYEGDTSFEHFIGETLKYLNLKIPQGQRPQVDELLKAMQSQKILLIMDGFERVLRAYSSMNAAYQNDESTSSIGEDATDSININVEIFLKGLCSLPNIRGKALMTTRLTPRAIKPRGELMVGCREEELNAMQKDDAVEFFHKQKIKGTHAEIETACALYGYHPLSLRLLAGRILKDFENPTDIVVAQNLKIDGDIKERQHHVLEVSYNSLPAHEQKLLSTIACFRSSVEHKTLQSTVENKDSLDTDLLDLIERGLLHFDENNKKFDLHPIVRHYAYECLTTHERTAAHSRLRDYFAVAKTIAKPQVLEDLTPVIELYHHTVRAGKLDNAAILFRDLIHNLMYYKFGAYQSMIELMSAIFMDQAINFPKLSKQDDRAWFLTALGNAYSLSGQPQRAIPVYANANELWEEADQKRNLAIGLGNVAYMAQISIGTLREAEHNLRHAIDVSLEIEDKNQEAIGHEELGHTLSYRGAWQEAERELGKSTEYWIQTDDYDGLCIDGCYRSLSFLLRRDSKKALVESQGALHAWKEHTRRKYPTSRTLVRILWLMGAAYRLEGQFELAEQHLSEALMRDRAINLVVEEADILLNLARLRYDQKNYEEAKSLAEEALLITERCGYVLQGADVNLFLAQYALEQEKDQVKAKEYAETALKLAMCDGPPYYYKVAYEEAERMLEKLK